MNIYELENLYKTTKESQCLPGGIGVKKCLEFIKLLLSNNNDEIKHYHYNLLLDREHTRIYQMLRANFKKRQGAENFLLAKLKIEKNPLLIADILHLLGGLKSVEARPMALRLSQSEYEYQREVSMYVLGWVGEEQDIEILKQHMINEHSAHLRVTAASAQRQMYWRMKELKNKLLASLKQGFENEKDDEVIKWIIVMIESIALKRLGLREDREDPNILHGDLEKAKIKAAKFLTSIDV